jgi:hypothetical protein
MKLQADSVWLATQPVDMRTGIDGLSLHMQQALGRAPCDGTAYVFSNRRRTRLKLVCGVATGYGCACGDCTAASSFGPEPYAYLRHVLTELPGRADTDDERDLLPFNYAAVTGVTASIGRWQGAAKLALTIDLSLVCFAV